MYIQSILLFTMKRATLTIRVLSDIYICLIKQNQSGKMLFFKFFFFLYPSSLDTIFISRVYRYHNVI